MIKEEKNFFKQGNHLLFFSNWNYCKSLLEEDSAAQKIHNRFSLIKDGNLTFNQEKVFYKGKEIDLLYTQQVFLLAKALWESNCPEIPFPNIVIEDNDKLSNGAFLEYAKVGEKYYYPEIFLHASLISSKNTKKILWVLGHELGHLFYRSKKIEPKIKTNFIPNSIISFIFIFLFINITACLFLNFLNPFILSPFPVMFFSYLIFSSFFTTKKRYQRYVEEFFCDSFSSILNNENKGMMFTYSLFNLNTHPNDFSRILNIKRNKIKTIKELHNHYKNDNIKINFFDNFLNFDF